MVLPLTAAALSSILAIAILVRAWQLKLFPRFSIFFSYLIYLLGTGIVLNLVDVLDGQHYPLVFLLNFAIK